MVTHKYHLIIKCTLVEFGHEIEIGSFVDILLRMEMAGVSILAVCSACIDTSASGGTRQRKSRTNQGRHAFVANIVH